MSIIRLIADSPGGLALGALVGALLGPAAAATSVTVPDRVGPWQRDPARWLLGQPATRRRRLLMTGLGAVVLGGLAAAIGWRPALAAFLLVGVLGLILAAIDLEHHRLPDRLTLTGALGCAVVLLVDAMLTGSWTPLFRGLLCAAVAFITFLVMALISPSGMGFGDVKLAALLSLHTGWLGWELAVLAGLAGFTAGALASLLLVLSGRATMRTAIPFGPALLVGAWLVVVASGPLG
ncbi:MAG: A24 family peptidase [Actinomycetota bacterium]|nr:A24 family peptidase [Actinomycetota bacterium]